MSGALLGVVALFAGFFGEMVTMVVVASIFAYWQVSVISVNSRKFLPLLSSALMGEVFYSAQFNIFCPVLTLRGWVREEQVSKISHFE